MSLFDRVRAVITSTGTGPIMPGAAVSGYRTFASAVPDGSTVPYVLEEGSEWEIGNGVYDLDTNTMTRSLVRSSTGALLSLTGGAQVFISPHSEDIVAADDTALTGNTRWSGSNFFGSPLVGEGMIYHSATFGLAIAGEGSTCDVVITNKSGQTVFNVPTGTRNAAFDLATNKRLIIAEATSSAITDFSTGGIALGFSRPSDGVDNAAGLFFYASAGGLNNLALATRSDLVFATAGGAGYSSALERMRVTEAGQVLISTTTPKAANNLGTPKLVIGGVGSSAFAQHSFQVGEGGGVTFDSVGTGVHCHLIRNQMGTNRIVIGDTSASFSNEIQLCSTATASPPTLVASTSGRIGIGVSSPSQKLEVGGGTNDQIVLDANGTGGGFVIKSFGTERGRANCPADGSLGIAASTALAINTSATERLRIDASGNVGIGTTSPGKRLDVQAPDNDGITIRNASESSTTLRAWTASAGTANRRAQLQAWRDSVGPIPLTLQESGGNVGIGLILPAVKLDVDGPVRVKSYTVATVPAANAAAGQIIYVSDESGGAVLAFSDNTNWRRVTDRAVIS